MPIIKSPTKITTVLIAEFGENKRDIIAPVPAFLNPPLTIYQERFQTDYSCLQALVSQDSFFHFPNLKQFVE